MKRLLAAIIAMATLFSGGAGAAQSTDDDAELEVVIDRAPDQPLLCGAVIGPIYYAYRAHIVGTSPSHPRPVWLAFQCPAGDPLLRRGSRIVVTTHGACGHRCRGRSLWNRPPDGAEVLIVTDHRRARARPDR